MSVTRPVLPAAGAAAAAIIALAMFLTPALGVPTEELLQDTLKSMVVSVGALLAMLALLVSARREAAPLRWHFAIGLPLLLAVFALGSMAWSHAYLGGVEAVRWFIFAVVAWVVLNAFTRERLPWLAAGIHAGLVVASLWTVLQFLVSFNFFVQGPQPASTFINRNFFAEYAVSALPFGVLLLARVRRSAYAVLMSASVGLVVLAVLMTGTRSALVALWLELLVIFPVAAWLYRRQLGFMEWTLSTRGAVAGVFVAIVIGLGLVPTSDPNIAEQNRGLTALERATTRTASISLNEETINVRMVLWKATWRMIARRPFTGIGAGAWENDVPLYQEGGAQLETDFYAHNEFLQLAAEYGWVGWIFLVILLAWLVAAAHATLTDRSDAAREEAPWRAAFLTSLLALFIVSALGFAWRLAATGAIFAVCIGGIAASDLRLAHAQGRQLALGRRASLAAIGGTVALLVLAVYISVVAAAAESRLVQAARIALTIGRSNDPASAQWAPAKAQMLALVREGIQLNPHYRKITPIVADELARAGDWRDALEIWESVLSSRPHIVAILCNVTRAYLQLGELDHAEETLRRARAIQPSAPAVRLLDVIVAARMGRSEQALALGQSALADGVYDYDVLTIVFILAANAGKDDLAERAMLLRVAKWPLNLTDGYLKLGQVSARAGKADKALGYFRKAIDAVPAKDRATLLQYIPAPFREQLAGR